MKVCSEEDVLIASQYSTLFDLSKTCGVNGKHIHCQFPYSEFSGDHKMLKKELARKGANSLFFKEVGLINLKEETAH